MTSQAPETKFSEVFKYYLGLNLKDQNPFSFLGKKKVELKRNLNQLKNKEPFDAYTGLGILAAYENNFELSLNYFKSAYDDTQHDISASMNYANNLILNKYYKEAIGVYLQVIENNPNNEKAVKEIIDNLIRYFFIEESEKVINLSKGINDNFLSGRINLINKAKNDLKLINEINLEINYVRQFINAIEKTYFENFTSTSYLAIDDFFDKKQNKMFYSIDLPNILDSLDGMMELASNMNDSLQEKLINIIETSEFEDAKLMSKKIYMYFVFDIDNGVYDVNAS